MKDKEIKRFRLLLQNMNFSPQLKLKSMKFLNLKMKLTKTLSWRPSRLKQKLMMLKIKRKTRYSKIKPLKTKELLVYYEGDEESLRVAKECLKGNIVDKETNSILKGGASSSLNSRMQNLAHDSDPKSKFTGYRSTAFVDSNSTKNIPDYIWEKYSWADRTAPLCSESELESFIDIQEVHHLRGQIAPWYCTIQPTDAFDRRYWTIQVNGDQYVSRAKACSKVNYFKSNDTAEDTCIVCHKLLLTTFHVFMPVYKYEDPDTVDKVTIWRWQKSWLKICYLHFRRKEGVEFIPGRNPNKMGKKMTKARESFHASRMSTKSTEPLDVPDEY